MFFSLLYFAFQSSKVALIVFVNIPFAATGGVFALALRGMPFSISAAVGFIALFGVAVLNGVVLLELCPDFLRNVAADGRRGLRRRPGRISASNADSFGCEPGVHPDGSVPRDAARSAKASRNGCDRGVDNLNNTDAPGPAHAVCGGSWELGDKRTRI